MLWIYITSYVAVEGCSIIKALFIYFAIRVALHGPPHPARALCWISPRLSWTQPSSKSSSAQLRHTLPINKRLLLILSRWKCISWSLIKRNLLTFHHCLYIITESNPELIENVFGLCVGMEFDENKWQIIRGLLFFFCCFFPVLFQAY